MNDKFLIGLLFVVSTAVFAAIVVWVVSLYRQRELLSVARGWPTTEATVESGALEATRESGHAVLPTFAFSYQVSTVYYSGRFSLLPKRAFPDAESVQSVIDRMQGRKLLLHYEPSRPAVWYLADELIDGCKVEQRIGSHAICDLSPSDQVVTANRGRFPQ